MDFKTKIDHILKAKKGISISRLARLTGLNSTLEKAYYSNREMKNLTTAKLLESAGINRHWWDHGNGPIFVENPDGIFQGMYTAETGGRPFIDDGGDYIRIHRKAWAVIDEERRQDRKEIDELKNENKELRRISLQILANFGRVGDKV